MATPNRSGRVRRTSRSAVRRGHLNVAQVGAERLWLGDLYHSFLDASWPTALALLCGSFLAINALFAGSYLACGNCIENARPGSFLDAFFFSIQTFATIGYGHLIPQGVFANVLVSIEAMTGLLGVAMVTGLAFAKFSRPSARVLFSRRVIITERDGRLCLMFRMANERANRIVDAQAQVVLVRNETTLEGESMRRFHDLKLERERSTLFAISWTVIHPIDGESPLFGLDRAGVLDIDGFEIAATVAGLDETFAQTVHARHSYKAENLVWNARFADILSSLPDGTLQIDYTRFDEVIALGKRA